MTTSKACINAQISGMSSRPMTSIQKQMLARFTTARRSLKSFCTPVEDQPLLSRDSARCLLADLEARGYITEQAANSSRGITEAGREALIERGERVTGVRLCGYISFSVYVPGKWLSARAGADDHKGVVSLGMGPQIERAVMA